ncbi:GNAT family N-acetyltransferase [Methanosarcina sp. T3]|uniref:GNAT family N-acetyltransferase n=1 Tax=Methanosarcina sp. T3 TaxID=3439062 RepID=UPI003F8307C1
MKITREIKTERLVIRKFERGDFEAFHNFMTDPEATKYLLFSDEQKTENEIRELFDYTINSYSEDMDAVSFAIAIKNTNDYIGSVGYAPDFNGKDIQIYWSINREFQNNGYATEATKALLQNLKSQSEKKIRAYCHIENASSEAVAKKVGMKNLGILFIKEIAQESRVFET